MELEIVRKIRRKSREQWVDILRDYTNRARIWIEDNGIKASIIALVLGMAIFPLFKFFLFLVIVAGVAAFFVWSVALPEGAKPEAGKEMHSDTPRTNGHMNGDDMPPPGDG